MLMPAPAQCLRSLAWSAESETGNGMRNATASLCYGGTVFSNLQKVFEVMPINLCAFSMNDLAIKACSLLSHGKNSKELDNVLLMSAPLAFLLLVNPEIFRVWSV